MGEPPSFFVVLPPFFESLDHNRLAPSSDVHRPTMSNHRNRPPAAPPAQHDANDINRWWVNLPRNPLSSPPALRPFGYPFDANYSDPRRHRPVAYPPTDPSPPVFNPFPRNPFTRRPPSPSSTHCSSDLASRKSWGSNPPSARVSLEEEERYEKYWDSNPDRPEPFAHGPLSVAGDEPVGKKWTKAEKEVKAKERKALEKRVKERELGKRDLVHQIFATREWDVGQAAKSGSGSTRGSKGFLGKFSMGAKVWKAPPRPVSSSAPAPPLAAS